MFQLVAALSFALTFFMPVSLQDQETEAATEVSTQVKKSTGAGTETVSGADQVEVETSSPQPGQRGRRSRGRAGQGRDRRSVGRRGVGERSGRGSSRRGRESSGRGRSNDRRSGRNPKRGRGRERSGRSGQGRGDSGQGRSGRRRDRSGRGDPAASLEEIRDMLKEILERLDELEERHDDEADEERRSSGRRRSGRGRPGSRTRGNERDGDNRGRDFDPTQVSRRLSALFDRDKDGAVDEAELMRIPDAMRERFQIVGNESISVGELARKMAEGARSGNRLGMEEFTDAERDTPAYAVTMAKRMGEMLDRNNDGTIDEDELARFPKSFRERMGITGSVSKAGLEKKAAAVFLQRMKDRSNSDRR